MIWRCLGRRFSNKLTSHFSSASGRTVWLMTSKSDGSVGGHVDSLGVSEDLGGNLPRCVVWNILLIHEDTHEFGDSKCRMRVIELDGDMVWQRSPWEFQLGVAAENVLEIGVSYR